MTFNLSVVPEKVLSIMVKFVDVIAMTTNFAMEFSREYFLIIVSDNFVSTVLTLPKK